jgi:Spy/CpxP family protein refolding chaperone
MATHNRRIRFLALLALGGVFLAPMAAQADNHHPPHHTTRHKVCHNARVRDHHGHYHNQRQCHWVNR